MNPPPSTAYKRQAKKVLENLFPRISCLAISTILRRVDFCFPNAYEMLLEIQTKFENNGDNNDDVLQQFPSNMKIYLKHLRVKKGFRVQDSTLLKEMNAIPTISNTKDNHESAAAATTTTIDVENKENNDVLAVSTINRDKAEAVEEVKEDLVELFECGCCFGDYPAVEMSECTADVGHKVCNECIYRYVSEQLDGKNTPEFQCIVDDKCHHTYHQANVLDQVLSPGLKRRTNEAIFRSIVEEMGDESYW